jgi:predicted ribosomally synthesized peptide with SipW-like signal peptide
MKKSRLLIAVLVCAVMMMGVGYAWWNEVLTVNGTVATGTFDVDFVNSSIEKIGAGNYLEISVNSEQDDDGVDYIDFTVGNLYPGAEFKVTSGFVNNGSIPVKLGKAEITGIDSDEYANAILVDTDNDDDYDTPISEWVAIIGNYLNGVEIASEETLTDTFKFQVNPELSDELQGKSVTFNLTFDWVQFNE